MITEYNPEIKYEIGDYDSISYEDLLQLEAKLAQLSGKENKHIVDSYRQPTIQESQGFVDESKKDSLPIG